MNTNNFSSWEAQYDTPDIVKNYNEQKQREEFIKETKKRELFQETFPTENYDNLERFYSMGIGIMANDGCHDYIDKTTSKVYSWNFCFNHCKLKHTSYNAFEQFFGKQPTLSSAFQQT
jgi:hypothetical protein